MREEEEEELGYVEGMMRWDAEYACVSFLKWQLMADVRWVVETYHSAFNEKRKKMKEESERRK